MPEPHAAQDMVGLGELDVGVGRDLDTVAPRVEKVEKPPVEKLHPHLDEGSAHEFLVIDRDAEMPLVVRLLRTPLAKLMNWSPK